ncbi:MAG: antitoxin [Terriglobales bacterium]
MVKTAKLFKNGRSQAVRLPAEFRFEGTEVYVRRDEATGEVILSQPKRRSKQDWEAFFTWTKSLNIPDDALPPPRFPRRQRHDPFA